MNLFIRTTSDAARNPRPPPLSRRAPPGKRGQSTVEFALIVLPLFIIIFAIIDYAQIYFYENALQNAMREAGRFATAGTVIQATNGGVAQYSTNSGVVVPKAVNDAKGREASRYGCIRMFFQSNCVISMPTNGVTVVNTTTLPGAPPLIVTNGVGVITLMNATNVAADPGPGQANDYIQMTATYNLHTITPIFGFLGGYNRSSTNHGINTYPVHVSSIIKNEPALLNFQHKDMYPDEAP